MKAKIKETELLAREDLKEYFKELKEKVKERFEIAEEAREKGLDTEEKVECIPVTDLAERAESIIGPKGLAQRYRQLFKELKGDRMKVIFKLFKEIIEGEWCKIEDEGKRVEQAIKTCLVIETEGVVVAPIDGVPKICISKNFDGSRYVDVYYAGPIRAAGGSSTVLPLILGDYARKLMNLDRYKPTEEEIERYVEEIIIYENEIVSRQYTMTEEEIRAIVRNCPVCINGVPTELREVSVHRDLERIPTNRIRGGVGLVVTEGLALKALKVMDWAKQLGLDWSYLEQIVKVKKASDTKTEIKPNFKYLDRIAAGRPLLAYPMKQGGFRIRYGRARNTGIMGKGINPATMIALDEFIAVGTHIRIERPGKAAQLFPCTEINGPIVLLKDGEVRRLNSIEDATELKNQIKKILFLGDLLVTYGDFRKTAHPLLPSPYVEEWWKLELEKALSESRKISGFDGKKLLEDIYAIDQFTAIELSLQLGIPLHPKFLHYYNMLSNEEMLELMKEARKAEKIFDEGRIIEARFELKKETKGMLEKIGIPHKIKEGKIAIKEKYAYSFLKTLGALSTQELPKKIENILESLSNYSGIKIRDKIGFFIGARMGRPEQAKPREMKGNPHVLFPIGLAGGNTRSINKAMESFPDRNSKQGLIKVEIGLHECPKCHAINFGQKCIECSARTEKIGSCERCGTTSKEKERCPKCNSRLVQSEEQQIDLQEIVGKALEKLKIKMPETVKGVKGLFNEAKEPEPIEKGILRAKHDIHIFRDGTSRFELLNAPLTHFKPKEIGLSAQKARELGYKQDIHGKEIEDEGQTIELFPQDIVVNEKAGDWLVRVSQFIDEELEKFYGLKAFYNAKTKEELIGELVIGLAPHTSAGIVGRIIGYSKARVGWGHPYFIMCKRRNCVHPKTKVTVWNEDTKKIEKKAIKELVEEEIKKNAKKLIKADSYGMKIIENTRNLYAFNLNPKTKKIEKKKIIYFFKGKPPKHWIKIITKSKRNFVMTPDHKFCYFKGRELKIKDAKNAQKGNLIPVLKGSLEKAKIVKEEIISVKKIIENTPSYCLEIEEKNETKSKIILWGNKLLQPRCDGDQDSVLLLMDALLNFSEHYLSGSRGGRMDAPLVFTVNLNPTEIDNEVYEMETVTEYPLEFYEKTLEFNDRPIESIAIVKKKLGTGEQYTEINFTHETQEFDLGPKMSQYVQLKTMEEKIRRQAQLQSKIMAVEEKDALERVIVSHLLPDIIGNTRAFSKQNFRCTNCNTKYRRVPLSGKCTKCDGGNLVLTIAEGSVRKYLKIAKDTIREYGLSDYLRQRIELAEREISSVFTNEKAEQKSLYEYI
ncbi:MAG: DNA polymerase II large subunit [Candidatus Diapherotrites archaeon]